MNHDDEMMSDKDLDVLLSHASTPQLPLGAKTRLLAKMEEQRASPKIMLRSQRESQKSRLGWLAGLPLAASLALGIYLGSAGPLESILPTAAYELLTGVNIDDPVTGIEDVENLSEDEFS